MKKRKFIYLNTLNFDGTVFQTQILDWLYLYQQKGLDFDIIHSFHIKDILRPKFILDQKRKINANSNFKVRYFFYFSNKKKLVWLNTLIIYFIIFKYFMKYNDVLIMSRAQFGREIKILKNISKNKIKYIYDNRAAGAEEMRYGMKKNNSFSSKQYNLIANLEYIEFVQQKIADKIFVVSSVLQKYFIETYKTSQIKFVLYPCLSTTTKFYYNNNLRDAFRKELGYESDNKVFVYSGGIGNQWHLTNNLLFFFNNISKNFTLSRFLILTKDNTGLDSKLTQFEYLKDKVRIMTVDNSEIVKYLNAADYGILFRENTIMNNVSSPSKFAEYMLCGLPTIISEGVGDYTQYCQDHQAGYVLLEDELYNLDNFDPTELLKTKFDRKNISELAIKLLSKEANIDRIVHSLVNC